MRRSTSEPAAREWTRDLAAGSTASQPGRNSQRLRPSYTASPAGQPLKRSRPAVGAAQALPGQHVVAPRPIAIPFQNYDRGLFSAKPMELGWSAGPIENSPVENLVNHWIKHFGLGFQPCVPGPKLVVIFHHIHFAMRKTPITRIFHARKALPG